MEPDSYKKFELRTDGNKHALKRIIYSSSKYNLKVASIYDVRKELIVRVQKIGGILALTRLESNWSSLVPASSNPR